MKRILIATLLLAIPLLCCTQTATFVKFGDIQGNIPWGAYAGYSNCEKIDHTFYYDGTKGNRPFSQFKHSAIKITKQVGPGSTRLQDAQVLGTRMNVVVVVRNGAQTTIKYTLNSATIYSVKVYTSETGKLLEEIVVGANYIKSERDGRVSSANNLTIQAPNN